MFVTKNPRFALSSLNCCVAAASALGALWLEHSDGGRRNREPQDTR
jgi:predicted outer membrane lipoprotein